ncbi:hypothetical protein WDW37_04990 [Bdellovibrionota bacterium FG-1]
MRFAVVILAMMLTGCGNAPALPQAQVQSKCPALKSVSQEGDLEYRAAEMGRLNSEGLKGIGEQDLLAVYRECQSIVIGN